MLVVPKKPNPIHPEKQQLCFVLNYQLLNKYINATQNGNKAISYYPLTNITDLLARLHNCKSFSSLDLRSRYNDIGLMPMAKLKIAFTTSGG